MAKILYVAKGADPSTITWPLAGPPQERFKFTSGTALTIDGLIGYGDGSATYPDGRSFPMISSQASTFTHQKS